MAGSGTAHLRDEDTLLRVANLVVEYRTKLGRVQAVSDISFDVKAGETLGIVGESGCGKSTTGRAVLNLERIASGSVRFEGEEIAGSSTRQMRPLRRRMQMIFQDPNASLNPRRPVAELVAEGLAIQGASKDERRALATETLELVGLPPERYATVIPRQLSGGQAQRVAIARAVALRPDLLICDEPVSALDVSVQAQVLNLLGDLKDELDLTMIFISHDLGVVRAVADHVLVMYLGKICEYGPTERVYEQPAHPYTRALLDSVPEPEAPDGFVGPALEGDIPSPLNPPSGCRFQTRCPRAQSLCAEREPEMRQVGTQYVACHFPLVEELAG